MSALGQGDIRAAKSHVRFTPESRRVRRTRSCLLRANSGHSVTHSITSSARASTDGGNGRAIAELRSAEVEVEWRAGQNKTANTYVIEIPL
jgi:hypothetical protein